MNARPAVQEIAPGVFPFAAGWTSLATLEQFAIAAKCTAREAWFRAIWRPHPTRIPRETRIHGSNQSRRERQGSDDRRRSRHAAALRAAQRPRAQQSALRLRPRA